MGSIRVLGTGYILGTWLILGTTRILGPGLVQRTTVLWTPSWVAVDIVGAETALLALHGGAGVGGAAARPGVQVRPGVGRDALLPACWRSVASVRGRGGEAGHTCSGISRSRAIRCIFLCLALARPLVSLYTKQDTVFTESQLGTAVGQTCLAAMQRM